MNNTLTIIRNHYKKHENTPDLKGYLIVRETLPPGEYEVGLYEGISKAGNKKFDGVVREKFKKSYRSFHDKD